MALISKPLPMNYIKSLLATAAIAACSISSAVEITVTNYTYGTNPNGGPSFPFSYLDKSGSELNDDVFNQPVWPTPFGSAEALVGWENTNPTITFNFPSTVNITSFTVWAADSDGSAGVALPSQLQLTAVGFDQTFTVTNPAGSGAAVALTFSGLNIDASSITLVATRTASWTMFTEVDFFGPVIPETSTWTAIAGVLALGTALVVRRRR